MMNAIINASKSDGRLAALVEEGREYAQIYLLAKQRHKGCGGTGELMTLKEEFRDVVDKMVRYCQQRNYLPSACDYDIDAVAVLFMKKKEE